MHNIYKNLFLALNLLACRSNNDNQPPIPTVPASVRADYQDLVKLADIASKTNLSEALKGIARMVALLPKKMLAADEQMKIVTKAARVESALSAKDVRAVAAEIEVLRAQIQLFVIYKSITIFDQIVNFVKLPAAKQDLLTSYGAIATPQANNDKGDLIVAPNGPYFILGEKINKMSEIIWYMDRATPAIQSALGNINRNLVAPLRNYTPKHYFINTLFKALNK